MISHRFSSGPGTKGTNSWRTSRSSSALRARFGLIFFGILGIIFILLSIFMPHTVSAWVSRISPGCLFRKYTGIACPGCGGTRAMEALLRGDIYAAFCYNLLLPISLFALAIEYIRLCMVHFTTCKNWVQTTIYVRFFQFYAALVCFWFIVRNLLNV